MIPNLILKLKIRNFPFKKKLSNSQVLFYWQSFAQKKERKRRKMEWLWTVSIAKSEKIKY
jgi:hypothetical protein